MLSAGISVIFRGPRRSRQPLFPGGGRSRYNRASAMAKILAATVVLLLAVAAVDQSAAPSARPHASDLGLKGILPTGPLDVITDVTGVQVGHTTVVRGDDVRTGVTMILPHPGNLFREKVLGAVFVGNPFGKLVSSTQVNELGEIETPILLTSSLSVPRVADFGRRFSSFDPNR